MPPALHGPDPLQQEAVEAGGVVEAGEVVGAVLSVQFHRQFGLSLLAQLSPAISVNYSY